MDAKPATLDNLIELLLAPQKWRESAPAFLNWPPDVFAVAAYLLKELGAYVEVVKKWPPGAQKLDRWCGDVENIAKRWRGLAVKEKGQPEEVQRWWKTVVSRRRKSIHQIASDKTLWESLVNLLVTADEACAGIGVPDFDGPKDRFCERGTIALWRCAVEGQPSTLCRSIHFSKLVVLPKMHTPQRGITIRSLSHHLSLCAGADVRVQWYEALSIPAKRAVSRFEHSLSILVVPYPYEVLPSQFLPSKKRRGELEGMDNEFGFFEYHKSPAPTDLGAMFVRLFEEAKRVVGGVDGIVFPETALDSVDYRSVRNVLMKKVSFLVAGVSTPAKSRAAAQNSAVVCANITDRGDYVEFAQSKHHRWCLDENQICQYGLGRTLDPSRKWWEHTDLGPRQVNFVSLDSWLCFSVMVCEDLARPDPVANVIRAVGPNLLIALLQDGPQLSNRWSSRFATVFADDPGTSVLTLTSIGMAQLSRPSGMPPSRVIALWKDRDTGAKEIVLPPEHHAVVLSLTNQFEKEWSADGRHDGTGTGLIRLAGVHPIKDPRHTSGR